MKILITSGGTKVKIDLVRSITNMSRGTFGSQICDSFYRKTPISDKITFMYAKNSRMPKLLETTGPSIKPVRLVEYDTFDDYRTKITDLLKAEKFDIIVLAAAVSDYGVSNYFDGKYHSSDDMTIKLFKLPKVITEVRALAPDATICGFKLLVNSTDDELRAAMKKQFDENKIDLCVGNDLRDIKNDNHRLTIKTSKSDQYEIYEKKALAETGKHLSEIVVDKCMEVYSAR